MNFFSKKRLSPPMDGLSVGKFSGLLSTALLNTQFYKTKSSCALLLYPVSAYITQVSIYTWIQNNALYRSAAKNSEPISGACFILACLPWCHKNSENSIFLPTFFMPFHCLLCLEPAESSNGEILLIIFQKLEHIPALKKYQWCRQNTFGGDQYGYNEKRSSYKVWGSWETWFYSISKCFQRKIIWTSGHM